MYRTVEDSEYIQKNVDCALFLELDSCFISLMTRVFVTLTCSVL